MTGLEDQEKKINHFKEEFKKELEGITNLDDLKELFAREIARRDKIIEDLRKQNEILMKTAFKQRIEDSKINSISNQQNN